MASESIKNNKKRVLFVITQSEMGGAQQFLLQLLSRLDPQKFESLVAIGQDGDGELTKAVAERWPIFILKKLRRNPTLGEDLQAVFELRQLIKKVAPDVLFLNSSKAGFIGSLAARFPQKIKNLKVVYRIGGWSFNDPGSPQQKILRRWLEKISVGWKDIIIVNNAHDWRQARQFKIKPRDQVLLIHNGLDLYKMNWLTREEARLHLFEKIAKQAGKIFQVKNLIGTVANFYPAKGLVHLIAAAEHFKNNEGVAFVVIGDGQDRHLLEQLIKERRLEKKVFLVGRLPQAQQWLTAFDIFVLPSVKEGFPWSVLEAMAAKVPVIATCVGAVPEIIENGRNGFLVDPGQPAQIQAAISRLLADDRLRREFGIQGHQTVLFKFSLDTLIKRIEVLL